MEQLESRTMLSGPPTKFVLPIGGIPQVDWAITAYTDRDPAAGVARDYRGRGYTFDGSSGVHFGLPDFATMDRGIEVYAAAPGTVVEAHDGEYDRQKAYDNPPPPGTADNDVLIDHGDGWLTRYGALRTGSVAVTSGQTVAAGQKIGLVGASGTPRAPNFAAFLKFEVTHDGAPVETFLDPATYWESAPPYAGDVPGLHNFSPSASLPTTLEAWEGAPVRHVFHPGEQVYPTAKFHGRNKEILVRYRFIQPNGIELPGNGNRDVNDFPQGWRATFFNLGSIPQLGTWQVALDFDGVELGRTSFLVADASQGRPEIKVLQADKYVVDGRTTPIDFGTTDQGAGATQRTFTLVNYGSKPLEVSDLTLPSGFSLAGGLENIAPGGTANLVVRMDDQVAGSKSGRIVIRSNDIDNGAYSFAVRGKVVGIPANVMSAEFLYETAPQRVRFTFDRDVGASLSAADVMLTGGPGGSTPVPLSEPVWDAATKTATFAVGGSGVLPDGNYHAVLSAAGVLNEENGPYDYPIFVLSGDANRDARVDFSDLVILAQNYGLAGKTFGQADFSYDGMVGFEDLVILAQRYGSTMTEGGGLGGSEFAEASDSNALSATRKSAKPVFNLAAPIHRPVAKRRHARAAT
jgi:hypothetical protein